MERIGEAPGRGEVRAPEGERDVTAAADGAGIRKLAGLMRGRRAVVLTGAGCSTESGIPDYRGPAGRLRARMPMRYREFVGSAEARRRYWSRSAAGWPRFSVAEPNAAHRALVRLEQAGAVAGVITQNVDGLHGQAGSRRVLELHGSLFRVRCLGCGETVERSELQGRIQALNPEFTAAAPLAPDGDAPIPDVPDGEFRVPPCPRCAGVLKPDVVFFGENVPPPRVARAWSLFGEGEILLVVGSSLAVFSGRRFVYRARDEGVPVAVVNLGETRGDEMAELKIEGRAGDILPRLASELGA